MPITTGFNHVATLTTDLDRHAEFYEKVFDADVTFGWTPRPDHPRMFILDLGGGAALNVFEVPADEIVGDRRRKIGGRGAIDHFGIAVDSLDALEQVKGRLDGRRAPTSARSSASATSGRCSSATSTAWSSRSARRRTADRDLLRVHVRRA